MKNMDEFRRSVYEKAEKKAAEEKAKKLKTIKFAAMAAAFAVIVIPAILVAGSLPKGNEAAEPWQNYNGNGHYERVDISGSAADKFTEKSTIEYAETTTAGEEAYTTTPVYTTTPLVITTTTPVPVFTQIETTRAETKAGDTSVAETSATTAGGFVTVTVGGKMITVRQGMSYREIRDLLGSDGKATFGAPIYRWECDDGTVLSVRFELTGESPAHSESFDEYSARLKAALISISEQ